MKSPRTFKQLINWQAEKINIHFSSKYYHSKVYYSGLYKISLLFIKCIHYWFLVTLSHLLDKLKFQGIFTVTSCMWRSIFLLKNSGPKAFINLKMCLFFFLICGGFCHTLKWNSHVFTCVYMCLHVFPIPMKMCLINLTSKSFIS